ncbi:hypothetical protein ACFQVC_38145 [Streptomyces monticola]|uniref:DUF4259 domain-containing protein n=1 Tax=Streptomyces monticola TaxID=2666263 RepID=A0ABW2JX26_9ACTN
MGYWGWIVIAKGDEKLANFPSVAVDGAEPLDEYVRGQWREIWLGTTEADPEPLEIATATDAPAMAVYVADEDCATLHAASPSGQEWTGVFEEETAEEYGAVPEGYRREDAVAAALAWAAEAGLTADPAKTAAAFADGWYEDLLTAFGLPEGEPVENP